MSRMTRQSRSGVVPRPSARYQPWAHAGPYSGYALAAIFTVVALQLIFLVVGCDWDFCGDEAEYWTWSRRLDWSYWARGPLIAFVIRLSTELLGGLSQWLTGSLMLAARMPAIVSGALTAWAVYRLAGLTTGSRRVGFVSMLILPAIPILAVGGVIITSDTPLVCCWAWAAVWAYRASVDDDVRAWVVAGLVGALGVLAKYSFLAFPASVGLFLILSAGHRRQLAKPGFWVMCLLCAGLGLMPIVAWNAHHGWAGGSQLADRVGLSSRSIWANPGPVLTFVGGEAAALGGVWWVAGMAAVVGAAVQVIRTARKCRGPQVASAGEAAPSPRDGLLYLLCLWGVIWSACLVASLLGETEVNWMVPGYVSLVVLIGLRVDAALSRGGLRRWSYVAGWCVCVTAIVAVHHTEWFYPLVARWVPPSVHRWPAPLRLYEPTARLRGHKVLAQAVAAKLAALEAQGLSPFVLTPTYALTATLSFYLPGQPDTYCLSWNFGMTAQPVNQHDLWHPNPRHDLEAFRGRVALVVEDGNMPPNYATHLVKKGVFSRMDAIDRIFATDRGLIVGAWDVTVCYDYQGIANYKQNAKKGDKSKFSSHLSPFSVSAAGRPQD
jgi:4-amino-4-deoxy-L-arabinose transferase-like glycosyltransferase